MYLTAIAIVLTAAVAMRRRGASRAYLLAVAMLVGQIALGIVNVYAGKHAGLIVGHLMLGTALWGTIVYAATSLMPAAAPAAAAGAPPRADRGGDARSDGERDDDNPPGRCRAPRPAARARRGPPRAARRRARSATLVIRDYIALTKPRIISLLLLTTVATMIVADPSGPAISTILWTMLGGYLSAGGAGAINHYIDRERDARMDRTRSRPLVSGRIEPWHGLVFGIVLGDARDRAARASPSTSSRRCWRSPGLLGYVFVYTLWLKPLTPQNIVIGGAAGAVPPLVGWAAATGGLAWEALYPFTIVFLWTPPHFWALSLLIKDDYARTGVPMLPVVKGEAATRRQIVAYTAVLVVFTSDPRADRVLRPRLPRRRGGARRRVHVARREAAARPVASGGAEALPVLARLPRPALLRDGRRPRAGLVI